jgi:hypothetical protein
LKILKMYYRNQMTLFKGLPLSNEYQTCIDDLNHLIQRIGGAEAETDKH